MNQIKQFLLSDFRNSHFRVLDIVLIVMANACGATAFKFADWSVLAICITVFAYIIFSVWRRKVSADNQK